MSVHMHVYLHAHAHTRMHMPSHMHAHAHTHTHAYTHVYTQHAYTHTQHAYTHIQQAHIPCNVASFEVTLSTILLALQLYMPQSFIRTLIIIRVLVLAPSICPDSSIMYIPLYNQL